MPTLDLNFEEGRATIKRPWIKPNGRRWSEFVLGRRLVLQHFLTHGEVRVSCYDTFTHGTSRPFFTDPVGKYTKATSPKVRYRIRVRRKT